jgi:hypothetical protein
MYVSEVDMPLLQVRDFPEDIYAEVSYTARQQNRTIAQQVIVLIKKGLGEEESNRERVRLTIERLKAREVPEAAREVDTAQMIRDMRDERTKQIMRNSGWIFEDEL